MRSKNLKKWMENPSELGVLSAARLRIASRISRSSINFIYSLFSSSMIMIGICTNMVVVVLGSSFSRFEYNDSK
jgi:hypothetical protein